ncbi:formylglycine-generating enzyme family protein [Arenibacter sp. M-2]|uniref:formylglycine-generating enzyme family protein n=1 Tax=unclassified Arenibacter TaxID=2615047 RepID=UPI000D75BDB2|nr:MULTISPECIES: formylglycine-generating enzyme family protein [unclassified Arenibacter]MDL5512350.1 formylglycine-generating enzyme family protein [Arenibacter sp. M-2]PXX26434.1 formylglycine-generating enzyme required for sulfatase activity [Arenibacter sp. ARW7G5Y1]|tara:strand:+ start:57266 stop:58402 length:1137 start_codon:yes stop_codon:yes gene_type:complete
MQKINVLSALFVLALMVQCKEEKKLDDKVGNTAPISEVTESSAVTTPILIEKPENINTPDGMVWIPGGEFMQGAVPQDKMAMDHEKPAHKVRVDGFFMDVTEVTNAQFAKFVKETGYITVAERAIDWEEMKTQVPEGTPKPHDSILQPGSLTFKKTKNSVPNLYDFSQWWNWTIGANWKQPNGPGSTIKGKDNEPVVQVAYEDALAYCEWAGRRLPTEAEWERAARGNKTESIYFWGDDDSVLSQMANTWEGEFPVTNMKTDGYEKRAKVKSYPPNDFGLYDMAGNVWEWTSDWYNTNYYNELGALNAPVVNPQGASTAYNPNMPYAKEKVMRGGSFLCNASYCASYRISSRMASSLDSSLEHLGFRTVATVDMVTED